MRSFWTYPGKLRLTRAIRALAKPAEEFCEFLAQALAYIGALALMAMGGFYFWSQLLIDEAPGPASKPGWSLATRSAPAYAMSQFDFADKTNSYEILRHPDGGRKDIFRWASIGEKPSAKLEIYRPGRELGGTETMGAAPTAITDRAATDQPEAAGVIDSKFGAVMLYRPAGSTNGDRRCLGFIKGFDEPRLRISGWSCQGDTVPATRAAIECMLNRLILLTAGNDPKLAELFAWAELRRGDCGAPEPFGASADWVTTAEKPRLRSTF